MEKINLGPNINIYPMPVVIVGCEVNAKANFSTISWVTRVNFVPPLFAVSINKKHLTPEGIKKNKAFSINIPSKEMVELVDYCGLKSGRAGKKSLQFEPFYGPTQFAPMAKECPVNIDCKLIKAIEFPTNTLFIGEAVESYSSTKFMTDGTPDLKKIEPLLFTMPDNKYWDTGEWIGNAWSDGRIVSPDN